MRCLGLTCDTGLGTCVWHLLLLSWLTLSGASLSDADVSIGSNQCFVQGCSNFTVLDGPLTVTVGGFVRAITEFSVATGNCMASGEFWMYFPVCTAYRNPVGTVIVARPDLTVYMPNAVAPLRLTALLTDPNCRVRPGFAYQRWSYQGNFDQDLYFKSYPLDRHFLRVEFADSSYTEQLVRYVPDNVALSEENVVQVSGWDFIPSSTWGDIVTLFTPGSSNSSAQTPFSMGRIQVVVSRGGLVYAFRILPPIVVLILTSLLTGVMSLKDLAFRLTITVTGMLSIVFMQYRCVRVRVVCCLLCLLKTWLVFRGALQSICRMRRDSIGFFSRVISFRFAVWGKDLLFMQFCTSLIGKTSSG